MPSLIERGFGVTSKGYNKPNLSDIMSIMEEEFKESEAFGQNFDFEIDKVLYQISLAVGYRMFSVIELGEQIFNNLDPHKAEGNALLWAGSFAGLTLKQESRAEGQETFYGATGTQIPTNQQIRTPGGVVFVVTSGGTISASGEITLDIEAEQAGESGNVPANYITELVTPLPGITSITNPAKTSKGQDQETEAQFRQRRLLKLKEGVGNNVDGIASILKGLEGVKDAVVFENTTTQTVDGIPEKSIAPYVLGGNNDDIANAIFIAKAGGMESFGDIKVDVMDSQNITHEIGFSRPTQVDIYTRVTLTKTTDYPIDGDDQIKEVVVTTINDITTGENVYPYKILTAISNLGINGLENIVVELSIDGSTYSPNFITINKTEKAQTEESKVILQ